MKLRKVAMLFGAAALSTSLLTACGNDTDSGDTADENAAEESNEDAVSGASISDSADDLVKALSADGNWIFAATADITVDEELVVDGDFHDKDDEDAKLYRKLALYTQDEGRNVLDTFTLTVPTMTVNSPNLNIQEGTIAGDVYVDAEGFTLTNSTVDGNVTFASEELKDSAKLDAGTVTGEVTVGEATDAVSAASISGNPEDLVASLATGGSWIFAATADITLEEDLTIAGEFHEGDDTSADVKRKLALYTTDADRNVDQTFTLTVPTITVDSPNLLIAEGTVEGDLYVNAKGLELENVTIDGNITFASEELKDSAKLDAGTVTGEITVAE